MSVFSCCSIGSDVVAAEIEADHIGLASISAATTSDPILQQLKTLIYKGQNWIPQSAPKELQRFGPIIPEITVTGNDILCKGERLILPDSL